MVYHVLNGDVLNEQLSDELGQNVIICRELMMDGNCTGDLLSEILNSRRKYFQKILNISNEAYRIKVEAQLNQLLEIQDGTEVYLWFEDDLFCQANFWFCTYILSKPRRNLQLKLVRPTGLLRYGFGGMDKEALLTAQEENILLNHEEITAIQKIWNAFQLNKFDTLAQLGNEINGSLPWINNAVNAHIARFPESPALGAHEEIMLDCIRNSIDKTFPSVFEKFSEEAAIYGYGDLQARKIYAKMISYS